MPAPLYLRASLSRVAVISTAILGLSIYKGVVARADVAGQQAIGSNAYPNGGLSFTNDMDVAGFTGNDGLYSMAIDPTAGYMLTGSLANLFSMPLGDGVAGHGDSLLTKVKLYSGGVRPTVAGYTTSYQDDPTNFGNISGALSMVIDTGSGLNTLSDHYAYVGASSNVSTGGIGTGGRIMKVQLFPMDANHPGGNPDAAPKVVAVYNLSGSAGFASAIDQNYAYFLSGTTITRVDLHLPDNSANKITTITGLPNLTYYKADMVNSTLVVQALGTGVVEINVAAGNIKNTGGVLSLNAPPTVLAVGSSSPGTFAADPTQPYAYLGGSVPNNTLYSHYTTTTFQSSLSKVVLSGTNLGIATPISPLPALPTNIPSDPMNVPGGQKDRSSLSLTAIDPDSHAIIVGTDNNLPGNVLKFSNGGTTDLSGPTFAGAIQMPYDAAYYQNTDPVLKQDTFPYRVGDINMRDVAIDPKSGYAYFGTDTNIPHLLQVQYSQKGSIKGDRIALPAGVAITNINFYSNLPAPPTDSSSGNIRLAIYGDNGGSPGSLVWQSSDIPDSVPAGGGWLKISSGLPIISAAGNYWLAWQTDSTLDIPSYSASSPASGFAFNQAYGDFPVQMPSAAGGLKSTSDQWSMFVQFTKNLPGDFNRDLQLTSADLPVMLQALVDLPAYQAQYGVSDDDLLAIGDFDNSGAVTNADIQGLLNLLINPSGANSSQPVPEPSSALQLVIAGAGLCWFRFGRHSGRGLLLIGLLFALPSPSAQALTFHLTYDNSVAGAPAGFLTAFNDAIGFYETNYSDPITINLQVGWGTINNQPMPSGPFGESGAYGPAFIHFGQVKTILVNDAKSAADQTSIANLPASDPTNNANFSLANAEAKALGLLNGNALGLDGFVGISSTAPFTFDPNNRAVPGKYDMIGVAEHEISEVMGRFGQGQNGVASGRYGPIDLFRYFSPGVLDLVPASGAYFSINGGTTVINTFNGPGGGDLSDWAGATVDSYNAGPTVGVKNPVSAGDVRVMDVIGYDRVVPGDFNRDGRVTGDDIPAMLAALTDLNAYKTTKNLTDAQFALVGDVNGDGSVTNADIQALLSNLIHGVSPAASVVSEPSTFLLAALGIIGLAAVYSIRHSQSRA